MGFQGDPGSPFLTHGCSSPYWAACKSVCPQSIWWKSESDLRPCGVDRSCGDLTLLDLAVPLWIQMPHLALEPVHSLVSPDLAYRGHLSEIHPLCHGYLYPAGGSRPLGSWLLWLWSLLPTSNRWRIPSHVQPSTRESQSAQCIDSFVPSRSVFLPRFWPLQLVDLNKNLGAWVEGAQTSFWWVGFLLDYYPWNEK